MRIQVTWNDIQAMKTPVEATWQEFEMQLPETEAPAGHGGCRDTSPRRDMIKPPRFDESMAWTLLHLQFKATVEYNNWADCKKAKHLVAILQGQAIQVLHMSPQKQDTKTLLWRLKKANMGNTIWLQHIFPS
jgi:hypothetical protein